MSNNIVHATDASFEAEVINSDIPVLVDYWAEWCGPCKMIAPVLEEVAESYAGKIKIVITGIIAPMVKISNNDENIVKNIKYG